MHNFLVLAVPVVLTATFFSLMYKFIPNAKVGWRAAIGGGLTSSVLFEISKNSYTKFVAQSIMSHEVYGSLASIPIFFLWVYLVWTVVLLGAVICFTIDNHKELMIRHVKGELPPGWHLYLPIACMYLISRDFDNANLRTKAPTLEQILGEIHLPRDTIQQTLNLLIDKHWIRKIYNPDQSRGFVPCTLPQHIKLRTFVEEIFFVHRQAQQSPAPHPQQQSCDNLENYIGSQHLRLILEQFKETQLDQLADNNFASLLKEKWVTEQKPDDDLPFEYPDQTQTG